MELAKQFRAFLENKPGRLSQICSALEREKVNIRGLTVMDSKEHSVLRIVTDDIAKTKAVLTSLSVPSQETEVIVVEMDNRPGSLARICERLAREHINIDYAYCSAGPRHGRTIGIFKVSNVNRAQQALTNGGNLPSRQRQKPGRLPTFAR